MMWTRGNQVDLLESGTAYFPAVLMAIAAAQTEVYVTGREVAAALMEAARRGVVVRVLVDGFGSANLSAALVDEMVRAGVEWLVFRPERVRFALRRHRLRRMHRKVVVVDGVLALVGGINIIDDMDTPHQIPPRYDYAVQVQGAVVGYCR